MAEDLSPAQLYNSQLDAFELYHKIQITQSPSDGNPALPALGHALAGSVGSAISNIAVFPLDLIITRLQVQRQFRESSSTPHEGEYASVEDAIRKIYHREGGVRAFYTGVVQDTTKSVLDAFLFFLAYTFLRQRRAQTKGLGMKPLPVFDELSTGFCAGAFSKFLTTPIANIVTRKQTSAMVSARSGHSNGHSDGTAADISAAIFRERGLQGFWSGYSASLVLTLNPSLTFFLYELFKRLFVPRSSRENPSARTTFLLAAVSKSIATTITYPFQLAKARAQVSGRKNDKGASKTRRTGCQESVIARARTAARSTVFATVLRIAQAEGYLALYEGVWGAVIKGFFSHGITMIVKETVHKFIIQGYYLLLKMLRRYPNPQDITRRVANETKAAVSNAAITVQDGAAELAHKGKQAYDQGEKRAEELVNVAKYYAGAVTQKLPIPAGKT